MTRPEYVKFLLEWPLGESLTSKGERRITRIWTLVETLGPAHPVLPEEVLLAPREWICDNESSRTEHYKEFGIQTVILQDAVLRVDQPTEGVPPFVQERAADKPGMWNFGQPYETRGKKQMFHPHLQEGVPDINKISKFLELRTNSDGTSLLSKFEDPVLISDLTVGEHWFYKVKAYDESRLPSQSHGPWAWELKDEKPDWMEACHGLKFEGLYSILADFQKPRGGLRGSSNKTGEGHRYNADARGREARDIYFHEWTQRPLAKAYARWCPLCSDGNYASAYLECKVDRH